jgi:4-hydroxybenzoate polyprenyltransferase
LTPVALPPPLTDNFFKEMRAVRAYVELLRPANVATALADVLAGYAVTALGNHAALPWLLLSTACLYAGGVVLNDYFDRDIDRVERPERPIPSGRIAPSSAGLLGGVLLASGVGAASLATATAAAIAMAIAGCVLLYDAWGKRQTLIGPVNMAACRGFNLLLGVAAVPAALESAWPLALLPLVYITAVTALSRGEVHGGSRGVGAFALLSLSIVVIAAAALAVSRGSGPAAAAGLAWAALLAWRVLPAYWQAYRNPGPGPIRQAIKTGVLSLVFLDAVIGATFAGAIYSLAIWVAALVAGRLARLFPVT